MAHYRLHLPLLVLLVAGVSGCALFATNDVIYDDDAHVVFLTHAECSHVVVKTQGDRFGILRPLVTATLRQADIFVGPLRPGHVELGFLPFPEQDLETSIPVEVFASGLLLADAQTLWRQACGFDRPLADRKASRRSLATSLHLR